MVMRTGVAEVHNLLPRQGIQPFTFHLVMLVDSLWVSRLWDVLLVNQHSSSLPMPLSRRQGHAERHSICLVCKAEGSSLSTFIYHFFLWCKRLSKPLAP